TQLTPLIGDEARGPVRAFQVIAVAILVVGAVVGSAIVWRGEPDPATAPVPAFTPGEDRHAQEAMWRAYARAQAAAAAAAEAEKARRAEEVAAAASPTQTATTAAAAPPAAPAPDIPASCDEYSGNRALGCALLLEAGFALDQMGCLDSLWTKESNWRETAHN